MKKLTLNRETLAELADGDLAAIGGGVKETTEFVVSVPLDECVQFSWQTGCSWNCTI